MRWGKHAVSTEETSNYSLRNELETARDPEWEGNFKIGVQVVGRSYADWIDLARIGTSDGCCEHIDQLCGSIQSGVFVD